MILNKPSKVREISIARRIEIDALYIAARIKIKELISEIGLSGLVEELARICENECLKTKDQTFNFLAVELETMAQRTAIFRDIYKVEKRINE